MKLIENPTKAISVWLLALASVLAGLEQLVPQLKEVLPESWFAYVLPAILVARLISQQKAPPKETVRVVERIDGGFVELKLMLAMALFAFVALSLTGCATRPAGRDVCYATADADAFRRYLQECEAYESTRDCPAAEAIERDHQAAQEVCP